MKPDLSYIPFKNLNNETFTQMLLGTHIITIKKQLEEIQDEVNNLFFLYDSLYNCPKYDITKLKEYFSYTLNDFSKTLDETTAIYRKIVEDTY